jgi:hypothetical protein
MSSRTLMLLAGISLGVDAAGNYPAYFINYQQHETENNTRSHHYTSTWCIEYHGAELTYLPQGITGYFTSQSKTNWWVRHFQRVRCIQQNTWRGSTLIFKGLILQTDKIQGKWNKQTKRTKRSSRSISHRWPGYDRSARGTTHFRIISAGMEINFEKDAFNAVKGAPGGTLMVLFANIGSAEIIKTAVLAAVGSAMSFGVSLLLRKLVKWLNGSRWFV